VEKIGAAGADFPNRRHPPQQNPKALWKPARKTLPAGAVFKIDQTKHENEARLASVGVSPAESWAAARVKMKLLSFNMLMHR